MFRDRENCSSVFDPRPHSREYLPIHTKYLPIQESWEEETVSVNKSDGSIPNTREFLYYLVQLSIVYELWPRECPVLLHTVVLIKINSSKYYIILTPLPCEELPVGDMLALNALYLKNTVDIDAVVEKIVGFAHLFALSLGQCGAALDAWRRPGTARTHFIIALDTSEHEGV